LGTHVAGSGHSVGQQVVPAGHAFGLSTHAPFSWPGPADDEDDEHA
jgi:hypothetical protein